MRIAGKWQVSFSPSEMAARGAVRWRRLGDLMLRIAVALPIGYGVATLWAMALSRTLPMSRSDATTTGMLVAFVICAGVAMWAFAARSGIRALGVTGLFGGAAGLLLWLSFLGGHP